MRGSNERVEELELALEASRISQAELEAEVAMSRRALAEERERNGAAQLIASQVVGAYSRRRAIAAEERVVQLMPTRARGSKG